MPLPPDLSPDLPPKAQLEINDLQGVLDDIRNVRAARPLGWVQQVGAGLVYADGLHEVAQIGDQVILFASSGTRIAGEVLGLSESQTIILPEDTLDGVKIRDEILLLGALQIAPSAQWIGRILDDTGAPMDNAPLPKGPKRRRLHAAPPNPAQRKAFGPRLETGLRVFNTLLPIVQAQRIGLFAGSGVGKSTLLAHFASKMEADVVVIAMIGERGRELRAFVDKTLGPEGMKRSVIVAATSDQSPLKRRRCVQTAMTIAEHFRDQGQNVLLLADSITRFAEAHREIAVASGEAATLRGFPASTSSLITSLCERAGPGKIGSGDITAIFSVLVAGSDMEEPIADIMRGVLDGHVILDRAIAERGRYPAIDAVKSVSRSLPDAASERENTLIHQARTLLGVYENAALMIKAGLYAEGSDPQLDIAVRAFDALDAFVGQTENLNTHTSFQKLEVILRKAGALDQTSAAHR